MGSGEDFFQVFTIYGHSGHVGHVNKTNQTFPQSLKATIHMIFGNNWPSGFRGEVV